MVSVWARPDDVYGCAGSEFFLMEVGVLTPDMCSFAVMDDVEPWTVSLRGWVIKCLCF
jgi:hypothetical protein